MSRAIIVNHIGKGLYRVKLQLDIESIKATIKTLEARIATANIAINGTMQTAIDVAKSALDAVNIPNNINIDSPEYKAAINVFVEKNKAYLAAVDAQITEKVIRQNAIKERGRLIVFEPELEKDIWCADFTTNLKPGAEVGVIDWYQGRARTTVSNPVIIPGGLTGKESIYNKVRDGRFTPQIALTPNAWWYAMMILPGMERVNPHYHKGTITAINIDGTVNVTIDAIYTQILGVEADELTVDEINLTNVAVKYMRCNVGAFLVGDRVVVEYPRRNIHDELATSYKASAADLTDKIGNATAELATADEKSKAKLLVAIASMQKQIAKLTALEATEKKYSIALKKYKSSRPQEITVIGFVEKPRACEGIAYQTSADVWRLLLPDGRDLNLGYTPALVGDFNWGELNGDGVYDCACVWSGSTVRHGGYNYDIGGEYGGIFAAGVIKDSPHVSLFTIKAIVKLSDQLRIKTVVVKDGVIVKNSNITLTTTEPSVTPTGFRSLFWGEGDYDALSGGNIPIEESSSILIDKSAKNAVFARTFSADQKGIESRIWNINLQTGEAVLINWFSCHSPTGFLDFIELGAFSCEHHSMYYDANGDICLIGLTNYHESYSAGSNSYSTYRKIKIIDGNYYIAGVLYDEQFTYGGSYTFPYSTNIFLANVIDNNNEYCIRINKQTIEQGTAATGTTVLITPTNDLLLEDISTNLPAAMPDLLRTHRRKAGDEISAATIKGFSAGCVKIQDIMHVEYADPPLSAPPVITPWPVNTWLEYRGQSWKIVNARSKNYTILI